MRNKLYWGLGVLIILFIAVGSFVFYQQWTELQQIKKEAAEADKRLEDHLSKPDEPIVSSDKPITKDDLPAADEGFKWVQHDDHFHQVPMDAPDEWQEGPHAPITQPAPEPAEVVYPHHALLDTHPVAALRAQAKESGHWSAKYIPPFPPDDAEANELGRNIYLRNYYRSIGDPHNPIARNAWQAIQQLEIDAGIYEEIDNGPGKSKSIRGNLFPSRRQWDLMRLSLTGYDTAPYKFDFVMKSNFTGEEYINAYNNQ